MNKKTLFTLAVLVAASPIYAQNMIDGVRFGSTDLSGTARYRSMAGAFGALGGDPSCMSDNPAGIAIYRGTNIASFTPHLGFTNTETKGSINATGKDSNFSVSNFSLIFSFKSENDYFVNFNLGFGIERKQQMFRKMNAVIDNPSGSFGGYLFEQANSYLDDADMKASYLGTSAAWNDMSVPLLSLMAYESFAIDEAVGDPNHVDNPIFDHTYQQANLRERTRHDNYNLSGAFNFGDVLYAGLTVRITDFNSMVEHCFSEDSDRNMNGDYITYDNRVETKGSGIGINMGLLWKPTEQWRIGAAVHSPVWMDMKEFNDASMEAYNIMYEEACLDAEQHGEQVPNNWSEYNDEVGYSYSTPWEYQFSTAYVFGSRAILSLEYDLTDFTTMRFSESKHGMWEDKRYYQDMNHTMRDYLQAQHTFKAGLEYRITPQLSLRAGYAYKTSPYKDYALYTNVKGDDISFLYRTATKPNYSTLDDQHYITGGIGWRGKNWTIDFSCMSQHVSEYYSPYPCDFSESDILDFNTHSLNWDLSFGYRF